MPDLIPFLKRQIGAIQSSHFETTVLVSVLYPLTRSMFYAMLFMKWLGQSSSGTKDREVNNPKA